MMAERRVTARAGRRPAFPAVLVIARLAAVCWGWLTLSASGDGLVFEHTRIELRAGPEQERIVARFACHNDGPTPLRIGKVVTDCSCLSAQATHEIVAPGGRAEVRAEFRVGNLRGTVEKHLWVEVGRGRKIERTRLDAVLVVPELVRVQPRTLSWTTGAAEGEQSFRVRVAGDEPIRLLDVTCSGEPFAFRIETVTEGREYLVHARPRRAGRPAIAVVNFKTDCRHEKFRTAMGFVHVQNAR